MKRRTQLALVAAAAAAPVIIGASPASAANYDPRVSPTLKKVFEDQPYTMPSCYSGYACVKVPLTSASSPRTREFLFTAAGDYSVSDWHGNALVNNRQTGGWTISFLGQNKKKLKCLPAGQKATVGVGPVYYVRISSQKCS